MIGEELGHDAGPRRGEGNRRARWFEQESCGVGGVQVVVEHPVRSRSAGLLVVSRVRQLGGVDAEQVVEGVAAGRVLGEQVRRGQFPQCLARGRQSGCACEAAVCASRRGTA